MNKLRECPFCGSKADYADVPESIPTCTNIKCKMSFGLKMSYDEWNTRAIDPRLKELDKMVTVNSRRASYEKYYWLGQVRQWLNSLFPELKEAE